MDAIVDGIDQVLKNSTVEDGKYVCLSIPACIDPKDLPPLLQNQRNCRSFDLLLKLIADLEAKTARNDKVQPADETKNLLSVRQQATLRNAFEILIGIAVLPNLEKGLLNIQTGEKSSEIGSLDDLFEVLRLFDSILQNSVLKTFFIIPFLLPTLCALLQLNYGNLKLSEEQKIEARLKLKSIFDFVYRPTLITQLMKIQQTSRQFSASSPPWVKESCGNLLTKCLMEANGFAYTVQVFVDLSGGKSTCVNIWAYGF